MTTPPTTPKPSATLILLRDAVEGVEVFLMRRTDQAAAFSGAYVFPGGAVDPHDHAEHWQSLGIDDATVSRRLDLAHGGAAYALAAIRECFEEAGLLLAHDASGAPVRLDAVGNAADQERLRKALAAGEINFVEFCLEHQLHPVIDQLIYFDHWITPFAEKRRFDVRFFLAAAPAEQIASHDNSETVAHAWLKPADALQRFKAGEILLVTPTVKTLEALAAHHSVAEIVAHFSRPRTIRSTLPYIARDNKGKRVLLPGDYAYAEIAKRDTEHSGTLNCELIAGVATPLSPTVRRIVAPNPGIMTGPGTNSYLVGNNEVAVIDPGPADESHIDALLHTAGGPIRWIFTTHTHPDHSPGATLLKARTGATVLGMAAPAEGPQDRTYTPDQLVTHGDRFTVDGITLRAIHTPGHASNHVCYLLEEERLLFTGDHIMQGSTVVISPPDGDMTAYLESLRALLDLDIDYFAPGHGYLVGHPHQVVEHLLVHRKGREDKILRVLQSQPAATLDSLLPAVYDDVPLQIHGAAKRSLLAHLIKLKVEHRVVESGDQWTVR